MYLCHQMYSILYVHCFMFVQLMQVKSVKTGSVFWAACTSLSYFYMVSMYYQFFELFDKDVR